MISCSFCELAWLPKHQRPILWLCLHAKQLSPANSEALNEPYPSWRNKGKNVGSPQKSAGRCDLDVFISIAAQMTFIKRRIDNAERYSFCKEQPWVNKGMTASLSFHFTVLAIVQRPCTSIPTSASPFVFGYWVACCVRENYGSAWFISASIPRKYTFTNTCVLNRTATASLWAKK